MITFLISFRVFATVDLAKNSKSAILIESTTGKILYEKNSNEKRSPASMTKMMTLLLTTEALENGKIKLDDMIAKLIVQVVVVIGNYILSKLLVFKTNKKE